MERWQRFEKKMKSGQFLASGGSSHTVHITMTALVRRQSAQNIPENCPEQFKAHRINNICMNIIWGLFARACECVCVQEILSIFREHTRQNWITSDTGESGDRARFARVVPKLQL